MSRDHARTEQMRPVRPGTRGFAERLALFVMGVDRARAAELLEGLSPEPKRQATAYVRTAAKWDSATRQGRMAVAFSSHPLAGERLQKLLARASAPMRRALFQRLPPWQQSMFPSIEGTADAAVAPAMAELAERLIREATR